MMRRSSALERRLRGPAAAVLVVAAHLVGSPASAQQVAPPVTTTPATAPSTAAAAAPPAAGTPATVIDDKQIESVLGKAVQSPTGEDLGHIVDILVDNAGNLRAAVIDFGGFFGVGSRKIAVDWHTLHFKRGGKTDTIVVELPVAQLRVSPVYKDGEPVVVLGRGVDSPREEPAAEPKVVPPASAEPAPK